VKRRHPQHLVAPSSATAAILSVASLAAATLAPRSARAEEAAPPAATRPAEGAPRDDASPRPAPEAERPVAIGVLGGVGFPRPLAIEAVVGIEKTVMLGAEYGFLPKTSIASVDARAWALAADVRVFPFRGAFFVGMRGGYQSILAEATLTAAGIGSYTESVEVASWFVNPRVGFLWTWKPLAIGVDAGVQIPIATTVSRSSLLALAAPDVDDRVTNATNVLGRVPLPTLDLLRVGLVF